MLFLPSCANVCEIYIILDTESLLVFNASVITSLSYHAGLKKISPGLSSGKKKVTEKKDGNIFVSLNFRKEEQY